jgi:hypothetical protein
MLTGSFSRSASLTGWFDTIERPRSPFNAADTQWM